MVHLWSWLWLVLSAFLLLPGVIQVVADEPQGVFSTTVRLKCYFSTSPCLNWWADSSVLHRRWVMSVTQFAENSEVEPGFNQEPLWAAFNEQKLLIWGPLWEQGLLGRCRICWRPGASFHPASQSGEPNEELKQRKPFLWWDTGRACLERPWMLLPGSVQAQVGHGFKQLDLVKNPNSRRVTSNPNRSVILSGSCDSASAALYPVLWKPAQRETWQYCSKSGRNTAGT